MPEQIRAIDVMRELFAAIGFGRVSWPRRLWEVDHIVPVVEGGGECGLDNLQTLCLACHKAKTAAMRKRVSDEPMLLAV